MGDLSKLPDHKEVGVLGKLPDHKEVGCLGKYQITKSWDDKVNYQCMYMFDRNYEKVCI